MVKDRPLAAVQQVQRPQEVAVTPCGGTVGVLRQIRGRQEVEVTVPEERLRTPRPTGVQRKGGR